MDTIHALVLRTATAGKASLDSGSQQGDTGLVSLTLDRALHCKSLATVDCSGRYEVTADKLGWKFAGEIDQPPTTLTAGKGVDTIGSFQEIGFTYGNDVEKCASIRMDLRTSRAANVQDV